MSASIDTRGLVELSKTVRKAMGGQMQRDLEKMLQADAPAEVIAIRAGAFTRIQKRAASTVDYSRVPDGIILKGGGGGSLGGVLFDGGEYGGRKSRKVAYATRSPLGTAYLVRRRTTMQFLPHLGTEGYFFWPEIRDWMKRLIKEQERILGKVLGGR